jgi:UDP:flavonoid glycosyltransferase YjiC (YdhE family)
VKGYAREAIGVRDVPPGKASRKRILFVAEAVTLAHVGRLHALAKALGPDLYEVCLACDPRYNGLIGHPRFAIRPLWTISGKRFFGALAKGAPIYDAKTLTAYVEEDSQVIDEFKPDIVIGDFRLSLDVSARLAKVPYVTITNAYWSPYARIHYPVPDIPLTAILGETLGQWMFGLFRPLAFALHASPLNTVRRHFGLPSLGPDLRRTYTHADYTLYADIPEIAPTRALPDNHSYIGPVPWEPHVPLPDWWATSRKDRPTIYVTLGSSGQSKLIPLILEAIADLPVTVMLATAGNTLIADKFPNILVADYLPGSIAAERASVVVCNGGSPTSYQALAAGKPVVGIATNLDQYLNMSLIEEAGAGILIRAGSASAIKIRKSVETTLRSAEASKRAQGLSQAISRYPAAKLFQSQLTGILSSGKLATF